MENILQKADQIDVVYAINEPAADGGMAALKAAGKDKGVIVVAIDGGCPACKWRQGRHHRRHHAAVSAADGRRRRRGDRRYIKTGKKPDSIDTGEKLITDDPMPGVPSITVDEGMKLCWG